MHRCSPQFKHPAIYANATRKKTSYFHKFPKVKAKVIDKGQGHRMYAMDKMLIMVAAMECSMNFATKKQSSMKASSNLDLDLVDII